MTSIKATVSGAQIKLEIEGALTGGMVGVPVTFSFDSAWDTLAKTAVFRAGGLTLDVVGVGTCATVPWEVLRKTGCTLYVGVYGVEADGTVVIPTLWAAAGVIQPGADPSGDESADPSLPVWQIAQFASQEALRVAQSVRADADDGKFNGKPGQRGPQGEAGPQGPKGEPGEVNMDDSTVGAEAWSSRNIADKLCPAFTEIGPVVTCEPVEGYPLEVVSKIEPVQEGSGDPSPDNVRPISGWESAKLWRGGKNLLGEEFTLNLGQTVYGGSLNWQTGELTVDRKMLTLTGTENVNTNWYAPMCTIVVGDASTSFAPALSNMFKSATAVTNRIGYAFSAYGHIHVGFDGTLDEFKTFLVEQNTAGTPVQVCYQLKAPTTIQLTLQEILALSGTNTLYSDTGDTAVTGRADLAALVTRLQETIAAQTAQISALQTAAVNNV